jgi:hypothetical protein
MELETTGIRFSASLTVEVNLILVYIGLSITLTLNEAEIQLHQIFQNCSLYRTIDI